MIRSEIMNIRILLLLTSISLSSWSISSVLVRCVCSTCLSWILYYTMNIFIFAYISRRCAAFALSHLLYWALISSSTIKSTTRSPCASMCLILIMHILLLLSSCKVPRRGFFLLLSTTPNKVLIQTMPLITLLHWWLRWLVSILLLLLLLLIIIRLHITATTLFGFFLELIHTIIIGVLIWWLLLALSNVTLSGMCCCPRSRCPNCSSVTIAIIKQIWRYYLLLWLILLLLLLLRWLLIIVVWTSLEL